MFFFWTLISIQSVFAVNYTVSGISSGGYMTGQVHVTHSSSITGAGIVAAGPYYCSQGSYYRAHHICTYNDSALDVGPSINYAKSMSANGLIDPVASLAKSIVYIFSGSIDQLMLPPILKGTHDFYKAFVPANQITFFNSIPADHTWPTKNLGNPCWYYGRPYVSSCGYDTSGIILTTLLGPLYQGGRSNSSNLFTFPQNKYANLAKDSMDEFGYVYVPLGCQLSPSECRLHVNIHGCGQNYKDVGLDYIQMIGINPWAEENNIIVIYPQTVNSVSDEGGCWDLDGYTGTNFALKSGIQVSAIHGMAQDYINIVKTLFK